MGALSALDDPKTSAAERSRLVSLAKWKAGEVAQRVSNEAIQMHGGIGVTDELDIGLYMKRIRVAQACLGDSDFLVACYDKCSPLPAHPG
jgi:alkylation response protein AidB-like acyl-CoA dehydrogenase